jgi:hypothetical protein
MAEPKPQHRRPGAAGGAPVLAGLGVVLGIGFWLWFDASFERQWREVQVGSSAEARRNPFLAAERFLARLDVAVHSGTDLAPLRELPDPADLIVVDGLPPLNAERGARLEAWVEAGGHLLVEAVRLADTDAPDQATNLLRELGVVLRQADTAYAAEDVIARVRLPGAPAPLEVAFAAPWYLEDLAGTAVGEAVAAGKARLLQYQVGAGLVHVVSDTLWLTNDAIGDYDHALLLAQLAAERDTVWLLHDASMPHLAVLLWRAAPAAMVSAALLLAALLWHLGGRLGPLLPEPPPGRRDLLEHLDAAGDFLWRHGRGGHLVRGTRRRVERDWLLRQPPLRRLDEAGRARRIAEQSRLPLSAVYAALYGPIGEIAELPEITATLQRLARPPSRPSSRPPARPTPRRFAAAPHKE